MFKSASEILAYIKKENVKLIDVRFIDLPGIQHHFNVPAESFDDAVFTEGLMFDGSSIRGFSTQDKSDLMLQIDWSSFRWLPADIFGPGKVMMFANVCSQNKEQYECDFRGMLQNFTNSHY